MGVGLERRCVGPVCGADGVVHCKPHWSNSRANRRRPPDFGSTKAEQLGISRERVGSIMHEDLDMRKLSAKWVPKCLNADQKVNGASRLSNFWNLLGAIQMISCRDWWPWMKPGYINMTRRQSNNQWSGSKAAHPAPKNSECKNPLEKFSTRFFGIIDYLPKGQTINAEYYSFLLV